MGTIRRWPGNPPACALLLALFLAVDTVMAQPVIDEFVSSAQVTSTKDCSWLRINFHVRVRYAGHVPLDRGDELRIALQLIDRDPGGQLRMIRREGVRVANSGQAGIRAVTLDLDQVGGPVLRIQFERPVAYQVAEVGNFESIVVAIANAGSAAKCKAGTNPDATISNSDKTRSGNTAGGDAAGPVKRTAMAQLSDADVKFIEASMDEARAAIKKGSFAEAIDLLKKVLRFPDNRYRADAQELLGVAQQKAGRTTEARGEYEDYLRRYPGGEASERVKQRLAGLLTAAGEAPERLRGSLGDPGLPGGGMTKASHSDETQYSVSGSMSSFYIQDDSVNTAKDISTAPNPNADPDAHRSHQNTLLSNFDLFGTAVNDQIKSKFKLAVTEEHQLSPDDDRFGVSTALVEYTLKDSDLMARIGRQTRNTGGVIGRFDGGVASWQATSDVRLNVVAGSPNWSRFDAPFMDGKSLYGASVDFGKMFGGLDTTLFAIEQFDRTVIDRQAVGAEFRYSDRNKLALGTIDYDVHFQQLNAAIFSGAWTLEDKSVINTALDYRKVPYLSSWNALQGQPFLTLYDMLKVNTQADVRQFAIDRTPTFESGMISYSRPLNETYQVGADATVTNLTGTVPSGGVDGTQPSGTEYYLSTQLTGTSLFKAGDMFTGALRYASLADSKDYVLDFNTRYPITNDFILSPRLRLGYRTGVGQDLKELTVLPSVLMNYLWSKDVGLEAEVGAKWIDSEQAGVKSTTKDIFVTLGARYDFNMDGKSRCTGIVVSCPWAQPAVGSREAPSPSQGSLPPVFSTFSLDGGLRYWYSTAKNRYNYFADWTPTQEVSRLSYDNLTAHSGEIFFRLDANQGPLTNVFLKGYAGGGGITGGNLYDEDFPPIIDPYSKTSSDTKGQLKYVNIDLGYNLFTVEQFRIGAFIGYNHWLEIVNASGCSQVGGNPGICFPALPTSMKVITEEDHWNTLRAGGVVDVKLTDKLKWEAEIAYASTSQHAQDTHYFTFGLDPATGHGAGFQAETVLKYQLTDQFNLGVGGRWWHLTTTALDSFDQLLKYETDRYGVFLQGSYRFH